MTIARRWRDRSQAHRWLSDLRTRLSLRPSTRAAWRARWSDPSYHHPWSDTDIPDALREALASGWLKAGDAVLDVGCGDGTIAAFLADAGCAVTAIDFAEGAVARTRERCGYLADRVHVELCDITSGPPSRAGFDAVIDVGCFQSLTPRYAARYARNVATACPPGARMLLILPLVGDWSPADQHADPAALRTRIEGTLGLFFVVVEAGGTPMRVPSGHVGPARAGLAVRLERR